MFDWQWGVQGMDFMNTSAAQWEDLATYVLFFCWWSSWWQVRGACPTSYGFMACLAIIQAGWLVRFQYRPRYSDHFSAALSEWGVLLTHELIWLWWYRAPAAKYIYILYIYYYIYIHIFQQWSELEPSPSFPNSFNPKIFHGFNGQKNM